MNYYVFMRGAEIDALGQWPEGEEELNGDPEVRAYKVPLVVHNHIERIMNKQFQRGEVQGIGYEGIDFSPPGPEKAPQTILHKHIPDPRTIRAFRKSGAEVAIERLRHRELLKHKALNFSADAMFQEEERLREEAEILERDYKQRGEEVPKWLTEYLRDWGVIDRLREADARARDSLKGRRSKGFIDDPPDQERTVQDVNEHDRLARRFLDMIGIRKGEDNAHNPEETQ